MRAKILITLVCSSVVLSLSAEENLSAEGIVKSILASERQLRDMQMQIACYKPSDNTNGLFYKWTWGYAGGKEFHRGSIFTSPTVVIIEGSTHSEQVHDSGNTINVQNAFDGQKLYSYYLDNRHMDAAGGVGSFHPYEFVASVTPGTLMGYDANERGRETLGEALSRASSLSVGESRMINGYASVCVEAIGVDTDPVTGTMYDVRVWVAPEQDFRPLRIEKCESLDGENRWKVPVRIVEDIELAQIDGVWFPIRGTRSGYHVKKMLPPEGMSQEEFDKLSPLEFDEIRPKCRFVMERSSASPNVLEIDPATIQINKGIPDEAFRVAFPPGCVVWDEFLQMGYTVGGEPDPGHNISTIEQTPVVPDGQTATNGSGPNIAMHDVHAGHNSGDSHETANDSSILAYAIGIMVIGILLLVAGIMWRRVQQRRATHPN